MDILLLTTILRTPEKGKIPQVKTIKDSMYYGMAQGFISAGHRLTMLAVEDYKPLEEEIYNCNIIFFKSRLKKLFRPNLIPLPAGYYIYIKKHQHEFDLIICGGVFTIPALFIGLLCSSKTVIWNEAVDHFNMFYKIPSKLWYNIVVRALLRKVLIIPRSIPAYNFISKYSSNVSREYVDHGVDISKFSIAEMKKKQFIVVSQLIQRKNINSIIRKFKEVNDIYTHGEFKLIIAGEGSEELKLKQLVKELQIENLVEFKGFLNHIELSVYISESYALLVYTLQDLNMVSIPEAIVSGTPVLTNMVPALAGFISENSLGIAKENWGADELIEIIVNNKEYSNQCMKFRDCLSSKGCASQIISIYEKYKFRV